MTMADVFTGLTDIGLIAAVSFGVLVYFTARVYKKFRG